MLGADSAHVGDLCATRARRGPRDATSPRECATRLGWPAGGPCQMGYLACRHVRTGAYHARALPTCRGRRRLGLPCLPPWCGDASAVGASDGAHDPTAAVPLLLGVSEASTARPGDAAPPLGRPSARAHLPTPPRPTPPHPRMVALQCAPVRALDSAGRRCGRCRARHRVAACPTASGARLVPGGRHVRREAAPAQEAS